MRAIDWFKTIAFALNDNEPGHEFQRYSLEQMIAAYNAAMCLIAKYRPDLFTEITIVKLTAGKYQDVRGCCVNVLDVLDQVDEQGNLIKELTGARKTKTTVKRQWKKPSCLSRRIEGVDFLIDYANIDKNLNGRFTIDPPVPCDVDAWVLVKCVKQPCPITTETQNAALIADCLFNEAAWHFVMARMLSGDRFSNAGSLSSEARYHLATFYETLGIAKRQEDLIESPEEA